MRHSGWFALILEFLPLFAFCLLAFLSPVGNPQESHIMLVRVLDFQASYWMRNAIPVPPPLLIAGLLLSVFLWKRHRLPGAQFGIVVGLVFLGLWCLIMLVPLLVHVN